MDATIAILSLFAGIGVFLVACNMLSGNLEAICSTRLRNLFARASDKKAVGVGIGTVATAAIQSSGATTVLVIGFVNAGIMSLTLAAAVIYGANIGTTITAQIVAWGMSGGSSSLLTTCFAAMAGVGAFLSAYAKKDKTKSIGAIIAAFGMLFVALNLMSSSMEEFAQEESVRNFLASIDNIVLLILLGAALTAVVQSSSVMTSVIIVMLMQGLIGLDQGIYLTMGSNIGSCVVAVMAGFTSGINAKRTAMIHLMFNIIGVIIFALAAVILDFSTGGSVTFGSIFSGLFGEVQIELAMFHTVFNVITVLIMLPLTGRLIRLVLRIIPDKKGDDPADGSAPHLYFVDDHMLKTPAIAVGEVKNEIVHMAELANENFVRSCRIVCTLDFSEKETFENTERQLNYTNKTLTSFLVKLSNTRLNNKDVAFVTSSFRSIIDIERVGDYAENIVEYAEKLRDNNESFSESAQNEIRDMVDIVQELYKRIMIAYTEEDDLALEDAYDYEQKVDDVTDEMADNHIRRLGEGTCSPSVGAEFLSLTSDIERIADHYINVGKTIRELPRK
ncbi:MAG: Na/Pi cotransporter family protein [archaeon]|nr:Na/Pi cotransporter family protein [archaeon]